MKTACDKSLHRLALAKPMRELSHLGDRLLYTRHNTDLRLGVQFRPSFCKLSLDRELLDRLRVVLVIYKVPLVARGGVGDISAEQNVVEGCPIRSLCAGVQTV